MYCRWLTRRDLATVLEIEQCAFSPESCWTFDDFSSLLKQRSIMGNVVCDKSGEIWGFSIHENLKHCYLLHNMAVRKEYRRRGAGSALVEHLIKRIRSGDSKSSIMSAVRETNLPTQLFLRSLGFRCISIEPDPYENCDEPAYMFEWHKEHSRWTNRITHYMEQM